MYVPSYFVILFAIGLQAVLAKSNRKIIWTKWYFAVRLSSVYRSIVNVSLQSPFVSCHLRCNFETNTLDSCLKDSTLCIDWFASIWWNEYSIFHTSFANEVLNDSSELLNANCDWKVSVLFRLNTHRTWNEIGNFDGIANKYWSSVIVIVNKPEFVR